jgi:hypothetical protein
MIILINELILSYIYYPQVPNDWSLIGGLACDLAGLHIDGEGDFPSHAQGRNIAFSR